jgi:nitrogen PTS system EIIA component
MYIHDLLSLPRVALALPAASKDELFERLAALLTAGGVAGIGPAQAKEALSARERLGSTGLGSGIALPHGRVAGLSRAIGGFCTLARPLDFAAIDHKPITMAFALLVPEHANNEHLKILAELAALFNDKAWREALTRAKTAEELYNHLTQSRSATATHDPKANRSRSV